MSEEMKVEEQIDQNEEINYTCKRCGYEYAEEDLKVDEEDLKEFVRSLLGNHPFTKEYSLFNGEFKVSYRTLQSDQSSRLAEHLYTLDRLFNEDQKREMDSAVLKLKLCYYTKECNKIAFPVISKEKDTETVLKECKDFLSVFTDNAMSILTRTLSEFLILQRMLIEEGYDVNFWEGAGLH